MFFTVDGVAIPFRQMIAKMPHLAMAVMNKCHVVEDDKVSKTNSLLTPEHFFI